MKISPTPHLDYAQQCFVYSQTMHREDWRDNWEHNMWRHLFWAAEDGELQEAPK